VGSVDLLSAPHNVSALRRAAQVSCGNGSPSGTHHNRRAKRRPHRKRRRDWEATRSRDVVAGGIARLTDDAVMTPPMARSEAEVKKPRGEGDAVRGGRRQREAFSALDYACALATALQGSVQQQGHSSSLATARADAASTHNANGRGTCTASGLDAPAGSHAATTRWWGETVPPGAMVGRDGSAGHGDASPAKTAEARSGSRTATTCSGTAAATSATAAAGMKLWCGTGSGPRPVPDGVLPTAPECITGPLASQVQARVCVPPVHAAVVPPDAVTRVPRSWWSEVRRSNWPSLQRCSNLMWLCVAPCLVEPRQGLAVIPTSGTDDPEE